MVGFGGGGCLDAETGERMSEGGAEWIRGGKWSVDRCAVMWMPDQVLWG